MNSEGGRSIVVATALQQRIRAPTLRPGGAVVRGRASDRRYVALSDRWLEAVPDPAADALDSGSGSG